MDVTAEAAVGVTAVTRSLDCPNARRRVTETPERVRTGRCPRTAARKQRLIITVKCLKWLKMLRFCVCGVCVLSWRF